jgi:TonB family protein
VNPLRRHARQSWIRPWIYGCLLAVLAFFVFQPANAQSTARKLKNRVEPQYPDLAKRNNISGTARLELTVEPDGKVKTVKVLGGNPVLVQAAVAAVSKWKYEPATEESMVVVKFDFNP